MSFASAHPQLRRFGPDWVTHLLVPVIYLAAAGAFIADVNRADTLAYGILYIPLVCTALVNRRRWSLWMLTALCLTMTAIGTFIPFVAADLPDLVGNRVLSALAIIASAMLVHFARRIQARLAAATERAEAAESLRTEVLSNLGREMRTPLHSMIAILGLLLTQSRTDQQPSLRRMRAGAQQLLLTLDNLIDLTQIDDRPLRPKPSNVEVILLDAVQNARAAADDIGVGIDVDGHLAERLAERPATFTAYVDPLLTRRILDNMLFNAIRVTPPDRSISVAIRQDARAVVVTVSDIGPGLPQAAAEDGPPGSTAAVVAALMTPQVGVGLTLGRRLAEAMGGSLEVETDAGAGTAAVLSLPLSQAMAERAA